MAVERETAAIQAKGVRDSQAMPPEDRVAAKCWCEILPRCPRPVSTRMRPLPSAEVPRT